MQNKVKRGINNILLQVTSSMNKVRKWQHKLLAQFFSCQGSCQSVLCPCGFPKSALWVETGMDSFVRSDVKFLLVLRPPSRSNVAWQQKSCGANHRLCPRTHTYTPSLADMTDRTMQCHIANSDFIRGGRRFRPEMKTEKGEKRFAMLGSSSPAL